MGLQRFSLCGAATVILLVQLARGQAPATQPMAGDIEIGTPPKGFVLLITPTQEGGQLNDNHHGDPLTLQEIAYNPATHEVGLAKNSPGKQRMYGNTRIDSAYYKSDLTLFDYITTDREPIGKIIVTSASKKLVISPNYVVSLSVAKPKPIDTSTYTAAVTFEKGDECNKSGTTVTMKRNAEQPAPLADTVLSKINRRTDVITWTIERGGAVVKTGSFGFPIVATEPDLVKYVIRLP